MTRCNHTFMHLWVPYRKQVLVKYPCSTQSSVFYSWNTGFTCPWNRNSQKWRFKFHSQSPKKLKCSISDVNDNNFFPRAARKWPNKYMSSVRNTHTKIYTFVPGLCGKPLTTVFAHCVKKSSVTAYVNQKCVNDYFIILQHIRK